MRIMRRIIFWVVLGAVMTSLGLIIVAWLFVVGERGEVLKCKDAGTAAVWMQRNSFWGQEVEVLVVSGWLIDNPWKSTLTTDEMIKAKSTDSSEPRWAAEVFGIARASGGLEGPTFTNLQGVRHVGWPIRIASMRWSSGGDPAPSVYGGVRVPYGSSQDLGVSGFCVPYRIHALGFAQTTAAWSLMIGAAAMIIGHARRYARLRRGRCGACEYDMQGDFKACCPECGWRLLREKRTEPKASPS